MRIVYSFILALSVYFAGCTYNISKNDQNSKDDFYYSITEGCRDRMAEITTGDSVFTAGKIYAGKDSLKGTIFQRKYWDEIIPAKQFSISNNEIKKISVTQRTKSILQGMLYGSLTAAVVGGVYHNAHPPYQSEFGDGETAILMMIPGAIIGGIVGGITGDDYIFSYGDNSEAAELQNGNSACRVGVKVGRTRGYIAEYSGISSGGLNDEPSAGYHLTLFYNYPFTMNLSLGSELSMISSGYVENYRYGGAVSVFTDKSLVLEVAPLIKLNLMKKYFTPYLFLGPQVDILLKGHSSRNHFFELVAGRPGNSNNSLSGEDKPLWLGLTAGIGVSTGHLLPVELLLELRYKEDLTKRYVFHSGLPGLFNPAPFDFSQTNSDLMFTVGVALDRL